MKGPPRKLDKADEMESPGMVSFAPGQGELAGGAWQCALWRAPGVSRGSLLASRCLS
jgi:hypothetical protein